MLQGKVDLPLPKTPRPRFTKALCQREVKESDTWRVLFITKGILFCKRALLGAPKQLCVFCISLCQVNISRLTRQHS